MKADVKKNYSRSRVQDGLEKGSLKVIPSLPQFHCPKCLIFEKEQQGALLFHYTSLVKTRERSNYFKKLNQTKFISPQRKHRDHYNKLKTINGEWNFLDLKQTYYMWTMGRALFNWCH